MNLIVSFVEVVLLVNVKFLVFQGIGICCREYTGIKVQVALYCYN